MANLYVVVNFNGYAAGTDLLVGAYPKADFVQNPKERTALPPYAATATATTDGSGNAEITGLSSTTDYWVVVRDVDGNHWFYVPQGRLGNSSSTRVRLAYTQAQPSVSLQTIFTGAGYLSLTGTGQTSEDGDLTQNGGFNVTDTNGDGISLSSQGTAGISGVGAGDAPGLSLGGSGSSTSAGVYLEGVSLADGEPAVEIVGVPNSIGDLGIQISNASPHGGIIIGAGADALGFYNTSPVSQADHPANIDDVITLLTNLGLCAA